MRESGQESPVTSNDFRELALGLPGAEEGSHMGHPDFRAGGRIFASLHTGDRTGMVKLTPEQQREMLRNHAAMFEPSAGAWGRQGCTTVILAAADRGTVRGAVLLAWENVIAKRPAKPRTRRKAASKRLATGGRRPRGG
jgi:hypothetical protein